MRAPNRSGSDGDSEVPRRFRFVSTPEPAETPSGAVVVDVMRAFTLAAWAFARGAEKIVLAESWMRPLS